MEQPRRAHYRTMAEGMERDEPKAESFDLRNRKERRADLKVVRVRNRRQFGGGFKR